MTGDELAKLAAHAGNRGLFVGDQPVLVVHGAPNPFLAPAPTELEQRLTAEAAQRGRTGGDPDGAGPNEAAGDATNNGPDGSAEEPRGDGQTPLLTETGPAPRRGRKRGGGSA